MRAPSAPFHAGLDEYVAVRKRLASTDRELIDRWKADDRAEDLWSEIQAAAAPDHPIAAVELIQTVVTARRTIQAAVNRMFGYAGIERPSRWRNRQILVAECGLKHEWDILHDALRRKQRKLSRERDLFAAHAMIEDAKPIELAISALVHEMSLLPDLQFSQKEQDGSRVLRLFMATLHHYFNVHCDRGLDSQVATLAEIAFDREVSVDQAASARRPTTKRARSK